MHIIDDDEEMEERKDFDRLDTEITRPSEKSKTTPSNHSKRQWEKKANSTQQFFEDAATEANDGDLDEIFEANLTDFSYCQVHRVICESKLMWPKQFYIQKCHRCLDFNSPGISELWKDGMNMRKGDDKVISTFILASHQLNQTLQQAAAHWTDISQNRQQWHDQQREPNPHIEFEWRRKERSAWLIYYMAAQKRSNAIRRKWNDPSFKASDYMEMDWDLLAFVRELKSRAQSTGVTRERANRTICEIHPTGKQERHRIVELPISRYMPCCICVIPKRTLDRTTRGEQL